MQSRQSTTMPSQPPSQNILTLVIIELVIIDESCPSPLPLSCSWLLHWHSPTYVSVLHNAVCVVAMGYSLSHRSVRLPTPQTQNNGRHRRWLWREVSHYRCDMGCWCMMVTWLKQMWRGTMLDTRREARDCLIVGCDAFLGREFVMRTPIACS